MRGRHRGVVLRRDLGVCVKERVVNGKTVLEGGLVVRSEEGRTGQGRCLGR